MPDTSNLVISGALIPPYSIRKATQTWAPIAQQGDLRRTVNGELINLSAPQFEKYASVISCEDQQCPALDGVWKGRVVTVDWIAELAYLTAGGSPEKTVVASRVDGDYTFYRPRMSMMVVDYKQAFDEYGAKCGWELALEEI